MATAIAKIRARAANSSDFHTLTGVQVLSCGAFPADNVVRNEDLAELGYDVDWIVQRTGILERRRAAADIATSDLAYEAAVRCLRAADLDASKVDLIIVTTLTPDSAMPSTSCLLQRRLGARAAAMDINAACSGFMYGLTTGAQFVKSGGARLALVVAADVVSRLMDPEDKKTYPLFGDGAGAVLLGAGAADQGLLSYTLGSDGSGADVLHIKAGGSREPITPEALRAKRQYVYMDGRPVFRWAVRLASDMIRGTLAHAGVSIDDLGTIILHQANIRIIDAIADDLGVSRDKLVINIDRFGNTSAASIPLALEEALDHHRIRRGDLVLMCAFGGGLTWGTSLIRW